MDESLRNVLPVRGLAARYAEAALHKNYNDVDVYVEDTAEGYRKLYSIILSRLVTGNGVALDRVFPLGTRADVIRAAIEAGASDSEALFIVDGDLYLLTGEFDTLPEAVAVLPRYCIENFIADPAAMIDVLYEDDPELGFDEIAGRAGYEGWYAESLEQFRSLFILFGVCHYLRSGIQTVSLGYRSICGGKNGDVDPEKVAEIVDNITVRLNEMFGADRVEAAKRIVEGNVDLEKCFLTNYVSAKDYVLPLLLMRSRGAAFTRSSNINFKTRLARKCGLQGLEAIGDRIRVIAERKRTAGA